MNDAKGNDGVGQHHQRLIITRHFFIPNQQRAKAVMPRMRNFDDPAARLSGTARLFFPFAFLVTRTKVGDITVVAHVARRRQTDAGGVGTQILRPTFLPQGAPS